MNMLLRSLLVERVSLAAAGLGERSVAARRQEDKILALGRFGRTEFAEHKQELLEHLAHPDTLLIDHLLVQAWGQAG
jgi:hypothetical protein